jgi:arginine/ornithine transport system permease protein
MDINIVLQHTDILIKGIYITCSLTLSSFILGFFISIIATFILYSSSGIAHKIIKTYVNIFRGTPLLMQLYLTYFGIAQIQWVRESILWVVFESAYGCAIMIFSLNTGAYLTNIISSYTKAMPAATIQAAQTIGLSSTQMFFLILLPCALKNTHRQQCNEAILTLHGSALASLITIQDILGVAETINSRYYVSNEGLITATIIYVVLSWVIIVIFRGIRRFNFES